MSSAPVTLGPKPAGPLPPPVAWQPRSYPQLLRGPNYRWWRGLLAIGMVLAVWLVVQIVAGVVIIAYFLAQGNPLMDLTDQTELTRFIMDDPWMFLVNNLGLAALIPAAGLTVWVCHGWRPRWVSSVRPRLRWALLLVSGAITAVVYGAYLAIASAISGVPQLSGGKNVALLFVIILLTTPLQSAGEEYLFRGVLTQAIGSWFNRASVAVIVSALSTALLFAFVHSFGGPQNFWLFFSRFAVGIINSYLVWRTGGLEAAIALHTVNNWFGLVPAVLAGGLGDALANPPQPALDSILQIGSIVLTAAIIVLAAHKMGTERMHDPSSQPGGTLAPILWPQPPSGPSAQGAVGPGPEPLGGPVGGPVVDTAWAARSDLPAAQHPPRIGQPDDGRWSAEQPPFADGQAPEDGAPHG